MTQTTKTPDSVWYLNGFMTKVKVIEVGSPASLCEVLEAAYGSKYHVGQRTQIKNRVLYPRHERQ